MAVFVRVGIQLLADLAVDLVEEFGSKNANADYKVKLFKVCCWPVME